MQSARNRARRILGALALSPMRLTRLAAKER